MQSDDKPPGDTQAPEVGDTPTSPNKPRPLRREAMMIATERQRGAILAAVCSFAGVGMGFGLSQMAATNSNCQHQIHVEHVRPAAPAPAQRTYAPAVPTYTWLGVEGHTARFRDHDNQLSSGAIVTKVFPGSPAARAGLQAGSLITGVEGTPVVSFSGLIAAIRSHDKGESVILDFVQSAQPGWQNAEALQARVVLGDISKRQLHELGAGHRR